jgi:4-hydroxy-2-oxoheptanedioate aldolase
LNRETASTSAAKVGGNDKVTSNLLKGKWTAGQNLVGAWSCLGSAFAAELCAVEGFDYVCVDLQHGLSHFDTMAPMLIAISRTGVSPIVRVPANQPHYMGKAFDAGAEAVIVPMVNSRQDAERAVAGCRYAPEGTRSFGPVRSGLFLNQAPPVEVNREALCLVMIETIGAVERAEEICATPGVDGVYVGPADLAVTMGLAPGRDEMPAEHAQAIVHVRETCDAHNLIAGIHTTGGAQARGYLDAGFRMVSLATDAALLSAAHRAELAAARGQASGTGADRIYS